MFAICGSVIYMVIYRYDDLYIYIYIYIYGDHIHDHLINAIGSRKISYLCLLDLSATFNTLTTISYLLVDVDIEHINTKFQTNQLSRYVMTARQRHRQQTDRQTDRQTEV